MVETLILIIPNALSSPTQLSDFEMIPQWAYNSFQCFQAAFLPEYWYFSTLFPKRLFVFGESPL